MYVLAILAECELYVLYQFSCILQMWDEHLVNILMLYPCILIVKILLWDGNQVMRNILKISLERAI